MRKPLDPWAVDKQAFHHRQPKSHGGHPRQFVQHVGPPTKKVRVDSNAQLPWLTDSNSIFETFCSLQSELISMRTRMEFIVDELQHEDMRVPIHMPAKMQLAQEFSIQISSFYLCVH